MVSTLLIVALLRGVVVVVVFFSVGALGVVAMAIPQVVNIKIIAYINDYRPFLSKLQFLKRLIIQLIFAKYGIL